MSEPPRPPTIYDVAVRANVSSATVSYVLSGCRNGSARISGETQERVLDAVEALGYAPNLSARNLRLQRTSRICLVLPRLGAPYYDALAEELQRQADVHSYTLIITIAESREREHELIDQLHRRLADGAVMVTPRHVSPGDLAPLIAAGLALLLYDPPFIIPGCDIAQTTETEACAEAVAHLIGKGTAASAFSGSHSALPITIVYGATSACSSLMASRWALTWCAPTSTPARRPTRRRSGSCAPTRRPRRSLPLLTPSRSGRCGLRSSWERVSHRTLP
jgi:DNA-binding LacI/PurR family transcriptional regulator